MIVMRTKRWSAIALANLRSLTSPLSVISAPNHQQRVWLQKLWFQSMMQEWKLNDRDRRTAGYSHIFAQHAMKWADRNLRSRLGIAIAGYCVTWHGSLARLVPHRILRRFSHSWNVKVWDADDKLSGFLTEQMRFGNSSIVFRIIC